MERVERQILIACPNRNEDEAVAFAAQKLAHHGFKLFGSAPIDMIDVVAGMESVDQSELANAIRSASARAGVELRGLFMVFGSVAADEAESLASCAWTLAYSTWQTEAEWKAYLAGPERESDTVPDLIFTYGSPHRVHVIRSGEKVPSAWPSAESKRRYAEDTQALRREWDDLREKLKTDLPDAERTEAQARFEKVTDEISARAQLDRLND